MSGSAVSLAEWGVQLDFSFDIYCLKRREEKDGVVVSAVMCDGFKDS